MHCPDLLERRAESCCRLHRINVVRIEMNAAGRKAAWIEKRDVAYTVSLAKHSVAPKPEPPPLPSRTFTDAEIATMLADLPRALTPAEIKRMIDDAITDPDRLDAHGKIISDERKRWRAEIAKLELRLDALTHEITKRQTIEAAAERRDHDHGEVVEMLEPFGRRRRAG